jgi:hypothetical protein
MIAGRVGLFATGRPNYSNRRLLAPGFWLLTPPEISFEPRPKLRQVSV